MEPALPHHGSDEPFLISHAKADRIDLQLDGLRLYSGSGSDLSARSFLDALRTESILMRPERTPPEILDANPFFLSRQGDIHASIKFRSARKRFSFPQGRPLISGSITCRPLARGDFTRSSWSIAIRLLLNPTRFIRHNNEPSIRAAANAGRSLGLRADNLLSTRVSRSLDGERIVDDGDNCLLGSRAVRLITPSIYQRYLVAYFELTIDTLQEMIGRAAVRSRASIAGEITYNLKTVETYWERACAEPLLAMQPIAAGLRSIGRFQGLDHPPPTSWTQNANAISVSCEVRNGVRMKVYAKTNKRIRYEVVHNLRDSPSGLSSRHTTTDRHELLGWLTDCSRHAADLLNKYLPRINRPPTSPAALEAFLHFMNLVHAGCPDAHARASILEILIVNGNYAVRPDDPWSSYIDRLARRGVLAVSSHRTWAIADEHLPAFEWFNRLARGSTQDVSLE